MSRQKLALQPADPFCVFGLAILGAKPHSLMFVGGS